MQAVLQIKAAHVVRLASPCKATSVYSDSCLEFPAANGTLRGTAYHVYIQQNLL